jgi:hypothetical protein
VGSRQQKRVASPSYETTYKKGGEEQIQHKSVRITLTMSTVMSRNRKGHQLQNYLAPFTPLYFVSQSLLPVTQTTYDKVCMVVWL